MKTMLTISLGILALVPGALALDGGFLLTTDYGTFGNVRSFDAAAPWAVSADLAPVPGDPAARMHEGKVYVLGRGGSNVLQVYDATGGFTLEREFSLGSGLNPQDVAFGPDGSAYVSCYDQAVLLKVDVPGETILETFDTSFLADADGLPETAWMTVVGDRLFIAVQRLDSLNWYSPTGPGAVAVFDMATDRWVDADPGLGGVQPIPLAAANPYTRFDKTRNDQGELVLRLGCTGSFVVLDGGVEEIDPQGLVNLGTVAGEAQLGGDIIGQITADGVLYVLVSDASFVTSLRRFDPDGGGLTVLDTGSGYDHADLAWDGGFQIFLADRAQGAAGLRVFDAGSGAELTVGPLATGLPPFMFVLPGTPGVTAVPTPSPSARLALGAPVPNPCNPRSSLELAGRPDEKVRVRVVDLRGRAVRTAQLQLDGRGRGGFVFGGQDDAGRALPAGVYRVVVQGTDGFAARSLTLLK